MIELGLTKKEAELVSSALSRMANALENSKRMSLLSVLSASAGEFPCDRQVYKPAVTSAISAAGLTGHSWR